MRLLVTLLLATLAASTPSSAAGREQRIPVTIHERPQDADHDGRYESLDIDARLPIGRPKVSGYVLGNLRIRGAPDSASVIAMIDVPGPVEERMTHQALRFPAFVTDSAGIATVQLSCDGEEIGRRRKNGPWELTLWVMLDMASGRDFTVNAEYTATTAAWPAQRFGWERYRVTDVRPEIQRNGLIRLHTSVEVLLAGPVQLEADAHWPIAPALAGKPIDQQPPIRWSGTDSIVRTLSVGRHTIDLVPSLRPSAYGRPTDITAESLYVSMFRGTALRASGIFVWTFQPRGLSSLDR
jgi:hypothetical protein